MAPRDNLPHILVILASTRSQRFADTVAGWLMPIVGAREDFTAEAVDLREWTFPYYDHPGTASLSTREDHEEEILPWADVVGKVG